MNLAEPARRVSPATCELAKSVRALEEDDEYKVEPAAYELDDYKVEPAERVDAAVPVNDARKFAPTKQLEEAYRCVSRRCAFIISCCIFGSFSS